MSKKKPIFYLFIFCLFVIYLFFYESNKKPIIIQHKVHTDQHKVNLFMVGLRDRRLDEFSGKSSMQMNI
jgi:hypothetical protein